MMMPFGKHIGWEIEDLPNSYLRWLHDSAEIYSEDLLEAIEEEYDRRFCRRHERPKDSQQQSWNPGFNGMVWTAEDKALFGELIQSGYRALALRHHPDHGGSPDTMRRLNALIDRLRKTLG